MRDRHLIGRDRELAELGRLLAAARNGTGGLVLLAGEAGVGKTRLAEVALVQSDLLVLPGGGSQDATLLAWADGSRGCPPLGPAHPERSPRAESLGAPTSSGVPRWRPAR
jgi:hypothetical protein